MAHFCSNCGNPIQDGESFCSACGTRVGSYAAQPQPQPEQVEPLHGLHGGYLAWSIINMILAVVPLGVIGLVFTIAANNTPMTRALGYLKVAKTVNMISSIIAGVLYSLLIFVIVFAFMLI